VTSASIEVELVPADAKKWLVPIATDSWVKIVEAVGANVD